MKSRLMLAAAKDEWCTPKSTAYLIVQSLSTESEDVKYALVFI